MEIIIQPDAEAASRLAARFIAKLIREKSRAVLGFATGQTPLPLYRELCRLHREEKLDFDRVTSFNLDEYVGLNPAHPASFRTYMWTHLFGQINIVPEHVHIPDGLAPNIPISCEKYEDEIQAAGGIDLQILGIGTDGHIGFNEPTSSLVSRTRIKTLTARTRRDNAGAFGGEDKVPPHVITMGLATIMECRTCLLLAFGAPKAAAVALAVEGPVTATVPASILQFHRRTIVLIDEEASSKLLRGEYYRYVYEHKPDWQKI